MHPTAANLLRTSGPALLTTLFAAALWIALRIRGPLDGTTFFGWLCLLLLIATIAAIASASFITTARRAIVQIVILTAAALLLISTLALTSRHFGARQLAAVSALFIAWPALWSALAWNLRRINATFANAATLTCATLLMASPVAGIPLLRTASTWGTDGTSQNRIIEFIRDSCPFLSLVSALRPAIKVDWEHLPAMYAWSGLGNDRPMDLPNPWLTTTIYAALAALLILIATLTTRRQKPK